MLYTFLTSEDLESGIKEEMLGQLIGNNLYLIALAESSAVSLMKDYLGQRFDMSATFPAIGEWQPGNDYGPAKPITVPGRVQQDSSLYQSFIRDVATESFTYTPLYDYNAAGRLTNYAWHEGQYYEALTTSLAVEPGNATTNPNWELSWRARDPRDTKLLAFAIDITIFNLFKRVAPRKIPDFRKDLFNMAKEWLEMVKDSSLTPDLPKPIKVEDSSDAIRWGSNPAQNHYY